MTTLKLPAKVSNEVAAGVSELYLRFNCDYCQEDIPGLRIKCAECSDFDLCLECFACGAQTG
jgi:transcriptional adapter 2-beta